MNKGIKLTIFLALVVFTTQNYCGTNQQYDHILQKCVCIYGAEEKGGCSPCPRDTYFNAETNKCQCNAGLKLDQESNKCIRVCGENMELNADGVCVCAPWYSPTALGCQLCPDDSYYNFHVCYCRETGYIWDQAVNQCVLKCNGYNELVIGKKCLCAEGTHRIKGVCQFCPRESYWVSETRQCPCRQTYELDEAKNSCIKKCGKNEIRNSDGVCVCEFGYIAKEYGICLPICQTNFVWSGSKCEFHCQANSVYDELAQKCVCNDKFTMNDENICIPICPQDQSYSNGECKCTKAGGYKQNGICKYCPADQSYSNGECRCTNIGHYMVDGVCNFCPQFSTFVQYVGECVCYGGYAKVNGECMPTCPIGQIFRDGTCQCSTDMFRLGGECVSCPQGSTLNQDLSSCNCDKSNYVWNRISNECDLVCPTHEQLLFGGCVCAEGYSRIDEKCVSICEDKYVWSEGSCKCQYGLHRIKGDCVECPKNTIYVEETQSCVCAEGMAFNQNNQCISLCGQNSSWSQGKCICWAGYHLINKICTLCPENTIFSQQVQACVCMEGTILNELHKCVSVCRQNQYWTQGSCKCLSGYHLIQGKCALCQQNSVYSQQSKKCICMEGTSADKDGKCVSICGLNEVYSAGICKCQQWHFKINGVCNTCPKFTQYSDQTQTCQCITGFQRQAYGNDCERVCPKQQISVDGQCRCKEGLFLIKGECRSCQSFSTYVSSEQQCVCQAGFLERQAGQCTPRCSQYQIWYNKQCLCTNPYYKINGVCGVCPQNSYFWGEQCICYYGLVLDQALNKCVSACSDKQNFVNGVCKCVSGLTRHNGNECVECPATSYYNAPNDKCECFYQTTWNQDKTECIAPCIGKYLTVDGKCV